MKPFRMVSMNSWPRIADRWSSSFLSFFLVSVLAACGVAYAAKVVTMEVLLTNLRNLYSPSILVDAQGIKRMWLGGWLTDSDPTDFLQHVSRGDDLSQVMGADKIFASELVNGTWTAPVLAFQKLGFHVNDPSVLRPPSSDGIDRTSWMYLYYTALENRLATDVLNHLGDHEVGLAVSVDGGRSWSDEGIVIRRTEGGDGFGAWSPSAIVVGNEIWVYYHTGTPDFSQPITFRTRFDLTGRQPLGAPQRLQFTASSSPVLLSNVDVTRQGPWFVMLANTLDLQRIVRYVSLDGLSWTPDAQNPVIADGPNFVLTPHREAVAANLYRIAFGFDTGSGSQSVRAWELATIPGDLNGDGTRNLTDVRLLIYMLIGQQPKIPEADLTGDGAVTLADLQMLIKLMVGIP
jgi:hypothetical protein